MYDLHKHCSIGKKKKVKSWHASHPVISFPNGGLWFWRISVESSLPW